MKFKKTLQNLNAKTKNKQWLRTTLMIVGTVIVFWIGYDLMHTKPPTKTTPKKENTIGERADKNVVHDGMSAQLTQQSNQMLQLKRMLHDIQQNNAKEKAVLQENWQQRFHALELKQQPVQAQTTTATHTPVVSNTPIMPITPNTIHMQVYTPPKPKQVLPISSHVTAGTSATALVLSGAATDAGASGQGNTIPIRLKIETEGRLPNGHQSSLKGCFLTASAYGNVSSERGEIRLQRISCVRKDGHVIEKSVEGTVVDRSGMNGISGNTVIRNAPMLWNAGISGFLSGIGSGLSAGLTTQSVSPLGTTQSISSSDVFKNGVYQGGQTALNKLSDYYIKMADLYHPVVEVHPGQYVDIFFLKGFSLDEAETNRKTTTNSNNSDGFSPLPYFQQKRSAEARTDLMKQGRSINRQAMNAIGQTVNTSGGGYV